MDGYKNTCGKSVAEGCPVPVTEKERCRQVAMLFEDFISSQKDLCVAWTERYGFVVLYDLVEDRFESSVVCRSAQEVFQELLHLWEIDYLYRIGTENGCEDFESSEESMTDAQRTYREERRVWYQKRLKEIL